MRRFSGLHPKVEIPATLRKQLSVTMSTPLRWKKRRPVPAYGRKRPETPLRALALTLSQAARSAFTEPFTLAVEHQRIYLRRLPKVFDGFRVVQLSDIHHSPFTSREQIERPSRRAIVSSRTLSP